MHINSPDELQKRIAQFQASHKLPGLETRESQARFAEKLFNSEKKLRALSMRKFAGSTDPSRKDFHPLKAIVEHFDAGDRDESIWLAFLVTHFGWGARSARIRDSVSLFYGKFGKGRWDWETICQYPGAVRDWIRATPRKIKHLRFGNHRKYETNNPDSRIGTPAVIRSFSEWVKQTGGGSPYQALRTVAKGRTLEIAFDNAYQEISVIRFGRTAKFDFLCLLGNLGVLEISPPHCYLAEGTGPKTGALQMVTGNRNGRFSVEVENTIRRLRKHLGAPVEAMEDALCNWQKRAKPKKGAAELGYVTTTCGLLSDFFRPRQCIGPSRPRP
jgi:Alpha-glutamyl/putrescinyl thymine pyrophosphorylase clade 3